MDAIGSVLDLAAAGVGYAVVAASTTLAAPAALRARRQRIDAPGLETTLCLVTPARQTKAPLPLKLAKMTRLEFGQAFGKGVRSPQGR